MSLKRSDLDPHPIPQFLRWYEVAEGAGIHQPDAMTLATATRTGTPSARIVLFKGLNNQGVRFFSNYSSRKAGELRTNPKAALVFFWSKLGRQVRIEGRVKRVSAKESDIYWASRPRESQLGAIASNQSSVIPEGPALEKKISKLEKRYAGKPIPRPKDWGGYCLIPSRFEFWSLGDFRVHDRYCYLKVKQNWKLVRLAP